MEDELSLCKAVIVAASDMRSHSLPETVICIPTRAAAARAHVHPMRRSPAGHPSLWSTTRAGELHNAETWAFLSVSSSGSLVPFNDALIED